MHICTVPSIPRLAVVVNALYLVVAVVAARYVYQQKQVEEKEQKQRLEIRLSSSTLGSICVTGATARVQQEEEDLENQPTIELASWTDANNPRSVHLIEPEEIEPKVQEKDKDDLVDCPGAVPISEETKAQKREKVEEEQPVQVRCRATFESKKPTQMSFNKGDVIRHVRIKNENWHIGVLMTSELLEPTGPVPQDVELSYPVKYVKPMLSDIAPEGKEDIQVGDSTPGDVASALEGNKSEDSLQSSNIVKRSRGFKNKNTLMIARAAFKGTKDKHMSFDKGDLIEILRDSGKWDLAILKQSKSYPITGKRLYVPHNYLKVYTGKVNTELPVSGVGEI